MKLRFEILGVELLRISLDIEQDEPSPIETVVDKAVAVTSRWWVGHMFGRR